MEVSTSILLRAKIFRKWFFHNDSNRQGDITWKFWGLGPTLWKKRLYEDFNSDYKQNFLKTAFFEYFTHFSNPCRSFLDLFEHSNLSYRTRPFIRVLKLFPNIEKFWSRKINYGLASRIFIENFTLLKIEWFITNSEFL